MKHCDECEIDISTNENYCPLCYAELETKNEKLSAEIFPSRKENVKIYKRRDTALRIFLFIVIIGIALCMFINYATLHNFNWSLLVALCIGYSWILVAHTIASDRSLFEKVFFQIIMLTCIVIYCQNFVGGGKWALDYVIPAIGILTILAVNIITLTTRKKYRYLLTALFIYFILLIFAIVMVCINALESKLMFAILLLYSAISIVGTLLFGWQTIKSELLKKMHI